MALSYNQKILLGNGGLWAMYDGLTTVFLIAYAIYLGASNTMIGLVGAIPYISMIVSQMPGVLLIHRFSRRVLYLTSTTIGRLTWILILVIPLLVRDNALLWVIIFYFIARFCESLSDPAWTSLAADVVPEKVRGTFFSKRLFLVGILGMIGFLAGGFVLDLFPKTSHAGFTIIFIAGILLGLMATWIMVWLKEPRYQCHEVHSLKDLANGCKGDFGKLVRFSLFFNFAYMISSPFFAAYMLENLSMSYSLYVIANAIQFIAKVFSQSIFGPMTDQDGDKPIAMLCVFGTGIIPLMFLFIGPNNLWLIIPTQIISGIVWAGVELTTFNLLLDMTDKKDRPFQVAEYQTLTAIPLIIGPIIGGVIADKGVLLGLAGIPLVFAISMILRFSSVFFLTGVPERRGPKEVPVWFVVREFMGLFSVRGMQNQIIAVKKYVNPK